MTTITWNEFIEKLDELLSDQENIKEHPILEYMYIDTSSDFVTKAKIWLKTKVWDECWIIDRFFFIELNKNYSYNDNIIVYFLFERNKDKNMYNQSKVTIENKNNDIFLDVLGIIF